MDAKTDLDTQNLVDLPMVREREETPSNIFIDKETKMTILLNVSNYIQAISS